VQLPESNFFVRQESLDLKKHTNSIRLTYNTYNDLPDLRTPSINSIDLDGSTNQATDCKVVLDHTLSFNKPYTPGVSEIAFTE